MQPFNLDNLNTLDSPPLPRLSELELPALSPQMIQLLIEARANIAQLNGYCIALPNPFLLLSPAILKESLASSEVENIHTTLVDALQNALFPEIERTQPDKEVLRYREALIWGFEEVRNGMPLVSRMIVGIQEKLIPQDGRYRHSQNVIWNPATQDVVFVPPKANQLNKLIRDWEIFVNSASEIDPLIRIAIAHYQFECIHPFDDGNGRTGRILMVLDLVSKNLLNLPILYLSGYISANKGDYYQALQSIRETGSWNKYLEFMLQAFAVQANVTSSVFLDIMVLLEKQKSTFKEKLPKIYSREILEELFTSPVVSPMSLSKKLDIHYTTASRYLKEMVAAGLLVTSKVGKNQLYFNRELIRILS